MVRKLFVALLGGIIFTSLAACGESEPIQGAKFVESTSMGSWNSFRCVEGYQPFDLDVGYDIGDTPGASVHKYKVLGMTATIESEGAYHDDSEQTEQYDAFYSQDWVSLKMTLDKSVELPVIIVHSKEASPPFFEDQDDQTIALHVAAGGQVDLRLATDKYVASVGRIDVLTLCLKAVS